MEKIIVLCDLCQAPIKGPVKDMPMYGVGLELYHSPGGWGNRTDDTHWAGEVCETCYEEYCKINFAVEQWLAKRTGTRAPTITITEREVSFVWDGKPSSNGYKKQLL